MKKRRLLAGLLALVLCVGMLPAARATVTGGTVTVSTEEYATTGLANVANRATPSSTKGVDGNHVVTNLVDGNADSLWIGNGFDGNFTLTFNAPAKQVSKIVLKFESGHTEFGMTVRLTVNGQVVDTGTAVVGFQNAYIYTFSTPTDVTTVLVELSNPTDTTKENGVGTFWPAAAEAEVWASAADNPEPPDPDAPTDGGKYFNAAKEATIGVRDNGGDAGKIVDGNIGTQWASSSGNYPADIDFALGGNMKVKKIVLEFERSSGRTFDFKLSFAKSGITSDYTHLETVTGHDVNGQYAYTLTDPVEMSNLKVTLTATNRQAYPALAEAKIFALDETLDLNAFDDITAKATEADHAPTVTRQDGVYTIAYASNQQVVGFRFTLPASTQSYTIEGRKKNDAKWTKYFEGEGSTDTEQVRRFATLMKDIRLTLTGATAAEVTDFQVIGTYSDPYTDAGNVAFEKPTHSNFATATSAIVTDGGKDSFWTPDMYPAYVDIDLEENYNINEIQVYTSGTGYTQYSIFTSMDGRDFTLFADKQDTRGSDPVNGDIFQKAAPVEARIVRVYLEYYSAGVKPMLSEVRVLGKATGTTKQELPALAVTDYENSQYYKTSFTHEETIAAVQNIVKRQVGADYVDWFTFEIGAEDPDKYDYFDLSDDGGGKVKIVGNDGVSLATGLNHYLKYYCNVHISQVGNQVHMPAAIVPVGGTVHKETKLPVRYAYNYCTLSYSMSFWNEAEWRNELDWLALNGVNVVLDITGQEIVWLELLQEHGYTYQEAKDFLAGPGYYAWAYMANLTGMGGPIHDSYLERQTEQARKNHYDMHVLGMEPVLQAYGGMVPVDITDYDETVKAGEVIPQGGWNSFVRPSMLYTDTTTFDAFAEDFYRIQKKYYGDMKYYATDPFHEGGNKPDDLSAATVASEVLNSLLLADPDAVWIIQSWQGNPTNGLLEGLRQGTDRRGHALVLDLYAERTENWKTYGEDTDSDGKLEFSDTPWVWCMLNNFGGRMGLHGYLDSMQQNIPAAANSAKHMKGVGITPEGSQENPLLYDFLYETIWTDDASVDLPVINLDQWLTNYAHRRYGAESENAVNTLKTYAETVYSGALKNSNGGVAQGAPESVVNARPATSIGAASSWGYSTIYYDKATLEGAARSLLADYDTLSASDAYLYDLADVLKQVLSNTAQEVHRNMAAAYNNRNLSEFIIQSDKFLDIIDTIEQVLSTRKEFTFGKWTTGADKLAAGSDDFTQRLYLRNAKALVTTWASIQQCDSGGLKDYSNRQWAGLTKDFYKERWIRWIDAAIANLADGTAMPNFNWFAWEWEYVRDYDKHYDETPSGLDLKELGDKVLGSYTVPQPVPAIDYSEYDIDLTGATATAGSQSASDVPGNVLDEDSSTIWHTNWDANSLPAAEDLWITLNLGSRKTVDGLRYQPRQSGGSNGIITGYQIFASTDGNTWGDPVAEGSWDNNGDWKLAPFKRPVTAQYIKLLATASNSDHDGELYASAATIRLTNNLPKDAVAGEVTISSSVGEGEDITIGTVLTAQYSGASTAAELYDVRAEEPQVSYRWRRGNAPIENATEQTYTVTEKDVGKSITCTVTVGNSAVRAEPTAVVVKREAPAAPTGLTPVDPTTPTAWDGKISGLNNDTVYELSADRGAHWRVPLVSEGAISGLPVGEYQVRVAATDEVAESPATIITLANPHYPLEANVTVNGDAAVSATLTATVSNMPEDAIAAYQWYRSETAAEGAEKTAIEGATESTYEVTAEDWDKVLYCVLTDGTLRYLGAVWSAPTAPVTKGTPAAPELTWRNPTTVGGSNGSISGFEEGVAYEYTVNGGEWADVQLVGGSLVGLSAGVYQVRLKATAESFASEVAEITLVDPGKAAVTKPTGLAVSDVTANSVVLTWKASISNAGDIAKYQIFLNDTKVKEVTNGVTTMLTGLSAKTAYTVRMVAVDDKGNSSPEATLQFTTASASSETPSGPSRPSGGTFIPGGNGGGPTSQLPTEGSATQTQTGADGTVTTTVTDYATGTVTTTTQQPSGRKSVKVSTPGEGVTITLTAPGDGEVLAKINLPETEAPAESVFADVPENHWAKDAVNELATLGLVKGTSETTFGGTMEMNRGMMATILYRLSGELTSAKSAFTDVKDTAYYAKAVDWASSVGILKGINAETYAPERSVSRQELAMMLYRYAGFLGLDTKVSQSDLLDTFTDKGEVASWTGDAMTWAVEKGLLKGRGNDQLAPVATATRAEVVVILDRFLDMIK